MTDTPDFNERVRAAEDAIKQRRGIKDTHQSSVRDRTRKIGGELTKAEVEALISKLVRDRTDNIETHIEQYAQDLLRKHREQRVVIEHPNKVTTVVEGLTHYMFHKLLALVNVRDQWGNRKNIFLKGPMGSGKSTGGKQVADALGLDFGYIGQTNMPHQVIGSVHPINKDYRHTAFTRIFRDGGVIMFEEMDGWHPNASLVLNPPLANGWLVLENGERIQRHPDCIIIACGNTWGTGATSEYVGRNKLDDAFMDRFLKVMWGYDDALERAAARNDEVVDAVQQARFNAETYGIKVPISPRCSIDIADMVAAGFGIREAMEMSFLSSCSREITAKLLEDVLI